MREARDIGGNIPQDLYSHLTEVFNRILLHHSEDAYDKFEEISGMVKQKDLKFKDVKMDYEVNATLGQQKISEREQWIKKSKNLINEVSLNLYGDNSTTPENLLQKSELEGNLRRNKVSRCGCNCPRKQ